MPESAYRASLTVHEIPVGPLEPGSECLIQIEIRNRGDRDWDRGQSGSIRAGNHWLLGDGSAMLVQDDGRTLLPARLPAGSACRLPLRIKAPFQPGRYSCEVDLVHEGVCWFKDRGSASARFAVRVGPQAEPAAAAGAPAPAPLPSAEEFYRDISGESADPGPFPMHGIHRDRIHEFFRDRGASVIDLVEDDHGGPEWIGYRYVVKKD